jgi:hypothetical protein
MSIYSWRSFKYCFIELVQLLPMFFWVAQGKAWGANSTIKEPYLRILLIGAIV